MIQKISNFIFYYYGALLLILLMHGTADSPNMILRLAFVVAVTLPLCITEYRIAPIVLAVFSMITFNGFDNSYMPIQVIQYILMVLVVFISQRRHIINPYSKVPGYLWGLVILVVAVNLINSLSFKYTSESIVAFVLFLFLIEYNNDDYLNKTLFGFSLVSLLLSVLYFVYKDQFTVDYFDTGFERTGWMDANYFSMVLGMGVVSSFYMLTERMNRKKNMNWFYFLSATLPFATMISVASRGGLLAVAGAVLFYFLTGRFPVKYKIVGALLGVFFLFVLYRFGYFELLAYRMTMEDSMDTGSGRTDTWALKLSHYFTDLNPFQQFFGIGYENGIVLGSRNRVIGFHNDFVAFLVEYGILGLVLYLVMLVAPIVKSTIKRKETIAFVIYLALCSFTLEPITSGRLSFFFFFIPILLFSRMRNCQYVSR